MTTTEQISQQLKALPPVMEEQDDRFAQVERRVGRARRRTAGATAAGVLALVLAGWGATQVLPGDEQPTGPATTGGSGSPGTEFSNRSPGTILGSSALAEGTTFTGAGVQEVDLSTVGTPGGTDALRLQITCEDPAEVMWPFRATVTGCRQASDPASPADEIFPLSFLVPVEDAEEPFSVQVTDDVSWELMAEPVEVDQIPLGVNERGQTYGVDTPLARPDLVEVRGSDLGGGYVEAEQLEDLIGEPPTTLSGLEAWESVEREPLEIPTYASDGLTVKGTLEIQVPVDPR
ncbi:hypothetical protein SGUI_1136 [Serinicoccus hydrothermalis]|uniref:Uncharacterized protein n=1 Tax=Serinicoccus hydrothermalis TaxID=1758689 RepID=A0A1B1NAS8_9MICO|nr:hypothetical protein [Serinicoccus hydrothermalis]ANS78532.1 hypothetical protein SGUI_1136 [Serinicoccus hydrothermalis]